MTSDRPLVPAPDDRRVRIVEGMATGEERLKCLVESEGKCVLVPRRPKKFPHRIPGD
jgi:hypothetical protein